MKVILSILLFCLLLACDFGNKVIIPEKTIELSLKQIIENHWDKNLFQLNEIYVEGVLTRGDIHERLAANYFLRVDLTDLGLSGNLRFHQREETLRTGILEYPVLRTLRIKFDDAATLESAYGNIVKYIQKSFPKIHLVTEPHQSDIEFVLIDFDSVGNVDIRIIKGDLVNSNHLVLNIQHSKTEKLGPEEHKKLLDLLKNKSNN